MKKSTNALRQDGHGGLARGRFPGLASQRSTWRPKPIFSALALLMGIAAVAALYLDQDISAHWRFQELCARDAGLHVYAPLDRDVGWRLGQGSRADAERLMQIQEIAFVRYLDEADGQFYDVYKATDGSPAAVSHVRQPADLGRPVVYEHRIWQRPLRDEVRMQARSNHLVDLRNAEIVVVYKNLSYRKSLFTSELFGGREEACPMRGETGTTPSAPLFSYGTDASITRAFK